MRALRRRVLLVLAIGVGAFGWLPVIVSGAEAPAASPSATPTDLNNRGVKEAQAGHLDVGVDYVRQAVKAAPQDAQFRSNLCAMLTDWAVQVERRGEVDRAQALLEEAIEYGRDNGRAYVQLGDLLYFRRSQFSDAVQYWKQAYGKIPAAEWQLISRRITQAQRDQAIERGFAARQTAHFTIRLQGAAPVDVEALAGALERAYQSLSTQLGELPAKLAVIVYTERDLQRLSNRPDWALGLYDGRIRLSLDELNTPLGPSMASHELAHAFLHQLYGPAVPTWVHEGFAQQQEAPRPRTPREQELERGLRERTQWIPLKWLEARFARPADEDDVLRVYAEARLAVQELVTRRGMSRFKAFLAALAKGEPVEAAYDQAFAPSRWAQADQGVFE